MGFFFGKSLEVGNVVFRVFEEEMWVKKDSKIKIYIIV